MLRSLVFLSWVGAAIYALLVVTNKMMPVVPEGTKVEFVARQTRLSVWGRYLPYRAFNYRWLQPRPSSLHLSKRLPLERTLRFDPHQQPRIKQCDWRPWRLRCQRKIMRLSGS